MALFSRHAGVSQLDEIGIPFTESMADHPNTRQQAEHAVVKQLMIDLLHVAMITGFSREITTTMMVDM